MAYQPTKITSPEPEIKLRSDGVQQVICLFHQEYPMGKTPNNQPCACGWKSVDHGLADSGAREVAANGFTREPDADKPDLSWLFEIEGLELVPREMIERIAKHFANGSKKYAPDNWRRGTSPEALARYRRSVARHVFAWFRRETDEDHTAAIAWNLFIFEINKAQAEREWTNE